MAFYMAIYMPSDVYLKQMRQMKTWITVKTAADYCLVSRVTVRRWIKGGRLVAIRLPSGHFRVSIGDFRDFLVKYDLPIKGELFDSKFRKERR